MDENLLKETLKDMLDIIREIHEEVIKLKRRVDALEKEVE